MAKRVSEKVTGYDEFLRDLKERIRDENHRIRRL
jgi:hypothetical protein